MLFSLGHGQHIVQDLPAAPAAPSARARGATEAASAAPATDTVPLSAVVPDAAVQAGGQSAGRRELAPAGDARAAPEASRAEDALADDARMMSAEAATVEGGKFRYFFPHGAGLPERPDMPALLDALADSMVEPAGPPSPAQNAATLPPVLTYLGQFIDHDITANTDRDGALSVIDGPIAPLPRPVVEDGVANLREGSLELDSLYGDSPGQGAFATRLAALMRFPGNRAKMRLARPAAVGPRVPLPATDSATDLLRLGFLLDNGLLSMAQLEALVPPALRRQFIDDDGEPVRARAIIGDARNDENLIVAQLQVLFLRLHNKLADATGGRSFERARRLTRWHYQWLVVNEYLAAVCDADVLREVVDLQAPLYGGFFEQHGGPGPRMPMPLEFSVAGFRFGHSMIRGGYDHNRVFGEAVPPTPNSQPFAAMDDLFEFTADGGMRGLPRLPQNWVIEWERWLRTDPARPGRSARKIDTELAPPLAELRNQPPGVFKHLARRNLRRGYRLNLPTAQACVEAVGQAGYGSFRVLTPAELLSGTEARRRAVERGGFDTATPLWFYVLKEAEVIGEGEKLGPLGSHIVANTLVGLIVNDPDSYWNADGGRWSPERFDAANPIRSMEDVARFCGML